MFSIRNSASSQPLMRAIIGLLGRIIMKMKPTSSHLKPRLDLMTLQALARLLGIWSFSMPSAPVRRNWLSLVRLDMTSPIIGMSPLARVTMISA